MEYETLKDYKPQKVVDGFEPFKGTFRCGFNYARIEEYSGEKVELKGVEFFRYELEVADHPEFSGRRLWKSYRLDDEEQLKKLADALFTLGLEFKSKEELEACAEKLVTMIVEVKAWHFKSKDNPKETVQMHLIKGEASEEGTTEKAPF